MKERPILFSGAMVRAILDGRKTQTRRVVKPQSVPTVIPDDRTPWYAVKGQSMEFTVKSPYGVPGDRLWVRESFQPLLADGVKWQDADYSTGAGYAINYVATDGVKEFYDCRNDEAFCDRVTPSIFMPRWASRITLEITDVRVQRLQEISEEDARAEGVEPHHQHKGHWKGYPEGTNGWTTASRSFRSLWDSINAKSHPWASNPWVWAVSFKQVQP